MRGRYWCEHAWLGGDGVADSVRIDVSNGRITAVLPNSPAGESTRLYGVTLPGFSNTHSHAFHRSLRGATHDSAGDFWTWREAMYDVAAVLDPSSYRELAERVFTEMLRAGYTVVGEFHYLHHGEGGTRYDDRNAMGQAIIDAARRVGIRLTLIDALYQHGALRAGGYEPPETVQRRFVEQPAEWRERVESVTTAVPANTRLAVAIHSVRTVDREGIAAVTAVAGRNRLPVHAHVSEQHAENELSMTAHGLTPTQMIDQGHALSDRFTAVHGTHLSADDVATIAARGATVCFCPTTERDLADGIGPSRELSEHGVRLAIGSDSQAFIDPFEESRAIELNRRLKEGTRGIHSVRELLTAGTSNGYRALGWPEGGALREGALADFITVRTTGPRMSGADPANLLATVLYAAHPEDVTNVVVAGINHDYA